jgi:ParB family chromosome partitioning protein
MSDEKGRPRQLGRGLEALFGEDRTNLAAAEPAPSVPATAQPAPAPPADVRANGLRIVPIGKLIPNPLQPRRHFDDAALKDLTASIREQGILQPLIVRPTRSDDDTFEIVAGERRWRAAQRAQVHEAPVIVRDFTDEEALAVALIENIQRDELSPLEEAEAFARLARDFDKTQEQVAEVVGKSRSHVANMMRLLDLPEDVRDMLADGRLTAGHARAILRSPDPTALALEIVSEGLSVREAERLGKASRGEGPAKSRIGGSAPPLRGKDADTLELERKLSNGLGSKVEIAFDGTGGFIKVQYRSLEQFEDLVERLMGNGPKIAGDNFEYDDLPEIEETSHEDGLSDGADAGKAPT